MQGQNSLEKRLAELQEAWKLPDSWRRDAMQWYVPLANTLAEKHAALNSPLCVGINGAQGTGKSTMAETLAVILKQCHHLNAVTLSLDDFYLNRAQRQQLADEIHPLLKTRGVPGTHDTQQAVATIRQLKKRQCVALPRFDKATDNPVPDAQWQHNDLPVDIIILEGWCVGLKPQAQHELEPAINELERNEDPDAVWRNHVNTRLASDYQQLFLECDFLVMLQAPGFEQVRQWRTLQEQKLADRLQSDSRLTRHLMSPIEIVRFIAHYERLTRHALATVPQCADVVLLLDTEHRITSRRSQFASP